MSENKTSSEPETIRYSIAVPEDIDKIITKYVPWGSKGNVILKIITDLSRQLQEDGAGILGHILTGDIKIVKRSD